MPKKLAELLNILLAAMNEPAFILDAFGFLQITNDAGITLCAAGFAVGAVPGKRMSVTNEAAVRLIKEVATAGSGPDSGEVVIQGPDNWPLRLSVVAIPDPITETMLAEPVSETHPVLIMVRPKPLGIDHSTLAASFKLTPAEARVLEKCVEGLAIAEVAALLRRSRRTVENQLQSIYRKTGVRRLSELLLLASRYLEPPGFE